MAEINDDEFPVPGPSLSSSWTAQRPSFPSSRSETDELGKFATTKRSITGSRSRTYRYTDFDALAALPSSPTSSLLAQRRPSLAEVPEKPRTRLHGGSHSEPRFQAGSSIMESNSPEEGTDFKRSLEINMKDLVGDAVGNMSISPSSRDIVLAARKGLFIIDLEHPLKIPRFLPQGGTWDVADVQWNPHHSRSQYVVSTSSEKMLIWNLGITGKTSIEHILKSHYRAITDFNWHTTECDVVASTGIDSWIWVWDIRNPRRAAFGLSAFKAAGTQVKWNRQDGNFLASSHGSEVLIWDRRKGSLPVTQITAHSAKIYGIDWSHHLRNEIVTCSLDKTIKTWDTNDFAQPKSYIQTDYPVWRARNLPFGQGVLSLPQRGETRLEMYARGETPALVETFEGHSDVVKEFVWRKGGRDEFQLITWSKDRTLRFWPVTTDTMQRVGHSPELTRGRTQRHERPPTISYRSPPGINEPPPGQLLLSAPVGNRAILAEVRAGLPPRSQNLVTQPHVGSMARNSFNENSQLTPTLSDIKQIAMANRNRGGTMSRGGVTGKSVAGMDQVAWLSNVKVGNRRGSSSGAGSGDQESSSSSRLGSMSRAPSRTDLGDTESVRQRSASRSRGTDDRGESPQSVQDELTTAIQKLNSSSSNSIKIMLEKHDLSKKRTCTLGLQRPWGENSNVFMRVTFTFPQKYPQGGHPEGTPSVDLERNPLISARDRAFMLKRLKSIRETKRPCIEACLKFLLFEGTDGRVDSESSDDDTPAAKRKGKETVSILRNHKNLAEPRTSQGAFGPNGELICFFRAPPRIVRNVLLGLTDTSTNNDQSQNQQQSQGSLQEPQHQSRLFQSPALVSDAIRRLRLTSKDRMELPVDPRKLPHDLNILRTMTNLLTVSQHKIRREAGQNSKNFSVLPTRRSNVFKMDTLKISGPDRRAATGYVFEGEGLAGICEANAQFASECGRYDHERIFRTLRSLFRTKGAGDEEEEDESEGRTVFGNSFVSDELAVGMIEQLYADLAKSKDVQMLAMISFVVLKTPHGIARKPPQTAKLKAELTIASLPPLKTGGMDYFTLARSLNNVPSPLSPAWSSPTGAPHAPSIASSNSSRGSWSSLFNTGGMRQLMNGLQDGLVTPIEVPPAPSYFPEPISKQNSTEKMVLNPVGAMNRRRSRKDSSFSSTASVMSKSWNEGQPQTSRSTSVSFSSAGHKRSGILRTRDISPLSGDKRRITFEAPVLEERAPPSFSEAMITQFHRHVYLYAELLFRWQLFNKRLELLNAVVKLDPPVDEKQHKIGLVRRCARPDCSMLLDEKGHICSHCSTPNSLPACTICRLPVRGLSRNCLRCFHVTHISCWDSLDVPLCPTGCGCFCSGYEGISTRPSTRLGFSPASNSLMLSTAV
ncbi:hypothetical protein FA15DRAFT_760641 [Coprinopsis marcescibilis]|uniref:WDR59/RTC1-like RING zinc finger domain-containing protein n=1 Tax=Coprinopsis marcescibilis TaxID=230819 RepID=A0A5C3KE42_COPMA|nr:hypothetical protein FA15DRAFT_760641 [Coprinopsis marcescibilis]